LLSDADKQLYARQILLSELGLAGQERLASASFRVAGDADPRVSLVARDYLARAGVGAQAGTRDSNESVVTRDSNESLGPGAATVYVSAASAQDVARLAGDPALEGCAGWLLGAFAAVEAIKAAAGVGTPAALETDFVLAREVG
jgi:hypothetical protein